MADTQARIVITAEDRTRAATMSAQANLEGLGGAAARLPQLFAAIGPAIAGAFAVNKIRGVFDMLDGLDDLAEKTGIAVESLSALRYAGEVVGTPLESIAQSVKKLATTMAEAAGGNKEAAATFKAMGIEVKNADGSLRNQDKVLLDLADRFAGYSDGAEKSALAVRVFGKSGADMIPLLNQGASGISRLRTEAEQLGAIYGGELAKQAAEFNDNMKRIGLATEAAAVSISGPLVTALGKLSNAYIEAVKNGKSFNQFLTDRYNQSNAGSGPGALWDWLTGGPKGNAAPVDAMRTMRLAGDAGQSVNDRARAMLLRQSGGRVPAPVIGGGSNSSKAADDLKRELEAQARVLAELSGYTGSYVEDLTRLNAMLNSGVIPSMEMYSRAVDELNAKQPGAIAAQKQAADAAREEAEAKKLATAFINEYYDAQLKSIAAIEDALPGMAESNERLLQEIELIGLDQKAQAAVTEARLQSVIALKEERLARLDNGETMTREQIALQEEIRLLKERAGLLNQQNVKQIAADEAKKAADEWKKSTQEINETLTDALMRGFESGKDFAKNMRDTVVNMFKTMVLRPVISAVMSPISAGITGMLGLGSSAAQASTGGGLLSSLGSAGGMLSGLSSLGAMGGNFIAGLNTGLGAAWGAGGSIMGGLELGAGLMSSGATAGGIGTMVGVLGPIAAALGALVLIAGQFKGETRSGGHYTYGDTLGYSMLDGPAQYRSGPSGGQIASAQVTAAIDATVKGINETLASLGSSASLIGFQAALETSEKGRGGVYAGGTLSGGIRFGDLGAGGGRSNYAGTLYDPSKGFSLDGEGALKAFALDLKQATIEALQAATDIPRAIADQLKGIDAKTLTEESATALLNSINSQIQAVEQFRQAMQLLPFEDLRDLSFDAASAMAKAAGGLDQLANNLATYYDGFFSAEEKRANTIRLIKRELDGAGFELSERAIGSLTRGDFRLLVEQFADMGDLGQPAYLALLKVSGAFASITEGADSAAQGLRDSIDAFRDVRKSLAEFQRGLAQEFGQLSPEAAYLRARRDFRGAASGAAAGNLADMQRLEGAASAFLSASQGYNASGAQYFTDFAAVEAALTAARTSAAAQVDVAQLQLTALADINNSVLSLPEALAEQVQRQMVNSQMAALYGLWSEANANTQEAQRTWRDGGMSDAELNAIVDISSALKAQFRALYGISVSDYMATQNHAAGGTFTNGVFSAPTRFAAHQMGEAGPEAVMPLTSINGSLGVRAVGDSRAMVDKLGRLEALAQRQADLIEVLINQQGAAASRSIATQQRIAAANERLAAQRVKAANQP